MTPGGDQVFSPLLTSFLAQRLSFLWCIISVFSRKVLLKLYLLEVIHFHLFVPLPGSLENAKTLKVPHAYAESSLDVLGIQVQVHQCACHRRNIPCTEAQTLMGLLLHTCVPHPGKEGVRVREGGEGGQASIWFQEAVPSITCVTPDDIRRQILDFMASHQGTFFAGTVTM